MESKDDFPRVGPNGLLEIGPKARQRIEEAVNQFRRDLEHAYRMAWYDGAGDASDYYIKVRR